jgi:large subunit ribosomal protein L20
MVRVNSGKETKKNHQKILKLANGFLGSHSRSFKIANQTVFKALKYSYFQRKKRLMHFRKLWIMRLNAICKSFYNFSYSTLIKKLYERHILINRKLLLYLMYINPQLFQIIFN